MRSNRRLSLPGQQKVLLGRGWPGNGLREASRPGPLDAQVRDVRSMRLISKKRGLCARRLKSPWALL